MLKKSKKLIKNVEQLFLSHFLGFNSYSLKLFGIE